ncbi:replication protein [Enterobacter kobei]|nr:replication protein [Enterobacter kobei]OEH13313.1 replication protein [Enterobacter kobei]
MNAVHADKGRHIAKLTLRNIVARDLPHVRAVTEQYAVPVGSDWIISSELNPLFHTFENLRELTRRFNQLADSTDEDIDLLAQDIAIYANAALAEVSETYAVLSPVDYSKRMLREGSRLIAYFGLIAPWASRRKMPLDEMAASIRKILDDRFWSRLLRKYARRWREHLHIAFGDVRRDVSPYCSKNHVKQWDARRKRSREIMSRLELEDQVTGERMSLIEQIDKSVSNPEKRRVELMTRIGGFEKVATESGYAGSFFTLTAPSKYHAYTAFGHRNHKWNGASPRRSQRYLNQIWQQIRAELARREIPVFGLRVAESHHDGTPHWHGLLFTAPEHTAELKEVMEDYATREDAEELTGKSGKQPRFELKPIDPALGSATGYVVKYISKNIDGYALDGENDHESGRPLKETAKHATAWASCWGIRQFQFVGGAPVSVWRELRRLRNQELADKVSPVFGELHRAAHAGDWQGYITLQGGPFVSRSRLVLRAWYQYKNEPTSYGEYQKSIKGLVMPASSIPPVETRLHSYRIVKMKPKSSDHADPDFDLKGASAPSWTRVNNCTEYKKHTTPSPLNPPDLTVPAGEVQPEQFEIGQLSREQRKQIAEDIRNHKSNQRVSPADQFEALALRITAGNCTDYDRARAESYMKAAHAIRQEACAVSEEVESLAQEIMGWAKLRKISINPVQALKLAQGGEVTALDTKYRANPLTGELIVTSADMRWRKTLARHKAETLVSRWREALIKF